MLTALSARIGWLCSGLFLATLATLMLEVLDTRLLSVLTWYHLSFVAVSVAMMGMAGGAVLVFVAGDVFAPERVARVLPGACLAFAIAIPVSHIANLAIPMPGVRGAAISELVPIGVATLALAIPFVVSGVVVTLALTRTGAPVGVLYGADLLGAATGCLVIVALLEHTNITSSALAAGACAALGSWCLARYAAKRGWAALVIAAGLVVAALVNARVDRPLGIIYPKDQWLWFRNDVVEYSKWNAHSHVTVWKPLQKTVLYWGPSENAPNTPALIAHAAIDGQAGTAITQWDGQPHSLEWVRYDVTAVPYHLRKGRVGVIGVGGGRDVLTAIWFGNPTITGIEINKALLEALQGPYRDFARVAGFPGVTLVHDEARSYLTRTSERFDVLQMSLIDTWAATGAGAFTLTENGLYTRNGWRVFLGKLTPTGVLSVSRWFDPENVSETTRLLSLGVASLIDFGIAEPRAHLLLVTQGRVATLLVSPTPYTDTDRATIARLADELGFQLHITPWNRDADGSLGSIADASSLDQLDTATRHAFFDFSAPTDRRPFFFNMLKARAPLMPKNAGATGMGIVSGNLVATRTLVALGGVAALLVAAVIVWPLLSLGRPRLPRGIFPNALVYFALIGLGFMFVQISLLQRFSVYLGHPTYAFSIILFVMILAAGAGSFMSDRLALDRRRAMTSIPIGIGGLALLEVALIQIAIDGTLAWPFAARALVVFLFLAPLAVLMGYCFPLGVRMLGQHSDRAAAWMWGVNGACGVMGSILAVMTSMWIGIDAGLAFAGVLYLLLLWPLGRLLPRRVPS